MTDHSLNFPLDYKKNIRKEFILGIFYLPKESLSLNWQLAILQTPTIIISDEWIKNFKIKILSNLKLGLYKLNSFEEVQLKGNKCKEELNQLWKKKQLI